MKSADFYREIEIIMIALLIEHDFLSFDISTRKVPTYSIYHRFSIFYLPSLGENSLFYLKLISEDGIFRNHFFIHWNFVSNIYINMRLFNYLNKQVIWNHRSFSFWDIQSWTILHRVYYSNSSSNSIWLLNVWLLLW